VISNTAIGIGVRISVYIQAFVPLIPLVVRVGAGVKFAKNNELRANACQSIIFLLLTGMALIVSAIIQQHTYGLSVFHALVVLNLCWVTVMGSVASYYLLRAVFEDPISLVGPAVGSPTGDDGGGKGGGGGAHIVLSSFSGPDGQTNVHGRLWFMGHFQNLDL